MPPRHAQTVRAREAVLARAAQLEALLSAVFLDERYPPDLEFGCFAAVVGPPGSDLEGEALLRMNTGGQLSGARFFLLGASAWAAWVLVASPSALSSLEMQRIR